MPSLIRLLLIIGLIVGAIYGAMWSLANFVAVHPREITQSAPIPKPAEKP